MKLFSQARGAAFMWPGFVFAQLTLARSEREIVIISKAGPTWKLVLSVGSPASDQNPGGGTVRALHVPSDNEESLVDPDPGQFCCAGWGLDNLEWRYVDEGRGVRSPLGTTASIESIEIAERSDDRVVISFPLKQGLARELRLRVTAFGTPQAAGRRYELWPEERGFVMFYPRWVDRNFEQRRYVFDYAWTIGEDLREPEPDRPVRERASTLSTTRQRADSCQAETLSPACISNQPIHE